jgi:hypothetical protein
VHPARMDIDVREDASADELLTAFFAMQSEGLGGIRAARMTATEQSFRRCFEGRIEQILTSAEQTILRAEREFEPLGAGARIAAPWVILRVLPVFLETWGGGELEDRRVQITVAERLMAFVSTFPRAEQDLPTLRYPVRVAVRRARRRYDLARLEHRFAPQLRRAGLRW